MKDQITKILKKFVKKYQDKDSRGHSTGYSYGVIWKHDIPKIAKEIKSVVGLKQHSDRVELLEKYSLFLEEQGYTDIDWRTEEPYAIDEFLKTIK
jgi:hypothetical protein